MADLQQQYEAVRYDDVISPLTDPATLGALGRMFGLGTADPARCRVLELGCGQGLNLVAMAARFPQAHFVGIDFIEAGLREGRALAAQAGLTNVELLQADLLTFDWQGEPFDYIVAWGVFSWVPDAVKARVLALSRAALAPQGLACICYLTYPGCKLNEAMRDLMRLRADAFEDFDSKREAARAVLQTVQQASAALGQDASAAVWRQQAETLLKKDATVLFHDELGGAYDPCYLLQFVDWAREHGLCYVTDADSPANVAEVLPPAAATALRALTDHALEREQISDYLTNRTLRVSVLARDADEAQIAFTPGALRGLCLSTHLRTKSSAAALRQPGVRQHRFLDARGAELVVDDRLTAAMLHALCTLPGQRLPFGEVLSAAQALSGLQPSDAEVDALGAALFPLVARKLVTLSLVPWRVPARLPERLRLSPLNRALLNWRGLLASAAHRAIRPSAPEAALFALLDGSRSVADIEASAPARALGLRPTATLLALALAQGCAEPASTPPPPANGAT